MTKPIHAMLSFFLLAASTTGASAADYLELPNGNLITKDLAPTEYVLEADSDSLFQDDEFGDGSTLPTLDASRGANRSPAVLGPPTLLPVAPSRGAAIPLEENLAF